MRTQRIEDIDLINSIVYVKQGKGRKDRQVPIPSFLRDGIVRFTGGRSEGPLFRGRDKNGLISAVHIRRIVKKSAEAAGLRKWEEVHVHTLRHSFATYLRNRDVDLDELKELLGHVDANTTLIYSKLAIEKIKKSVNRAWGETAFINE